MKYIKKFEGVTYLPPNNTIKIGDYVIAKDNSDFDTDESNFFLKNNVGIVDDVCKGSSKRIYYIIIYLDVPEDLRETYASYSDNAFSLYSSEIRLATPEEIKKYEILRRSKKYNL